VPFLGGNYLDHGRGRDHTLLRSEVPTITGGSLLPLACTLNRKNTARGQIAIAERVACQWLLGEHNGRRVPKSEAALECHSEPLDLGAAPVCALSFPGAPLLIVASSTATRSITQSKSGGSARNIPALAISA
jgi:hypothetical protein